MKKSFFSALFVHTLLLLFVIAWVLPTFGLFVSSFRDKDLLATSGWWTSFKTNQVNEIHRTKKYTDQYQENGIYLLKGNFFEDNSKKKITSYGITSKDIKKYKVGEIAKLNNGTEIEVKENGEYIWKSSKPFNNKRGKRIFVTALSPPKFTLSNYKEVLFK